MEELKHEKGMKESIVELKSLIRWHRVNNNSTSSNSARKTRISGSLAGRITKMLIYGKGRKSETYLEIGEIKKASEDFANQKKGTDARKQNNTKIKGKFKNKSIN